MVRRTISSEERREFGRAAGTMSDSPSGEYGHTEAPPDQISGSGVLFFSH
jgi:hypothetical protein